MNKLFSMKKEHLNYVIYIFGIKIRCGSLKLTNNELKKFRGETRFDLMNFWRKFVWLKGGNFSYKEKKWFLETKMYESTGYFPNLDNPKTFNEKLNWMKLNYDNPIMKKCYDKHEFKNYIKEKLGEGYTIPLIGIYENVNDIDFASLPDKFVAKNTLEGGGRGIYVIKDKSKTDLDKLKYELNNMLMDWNTSYYSILSKSCEGLKPRIIIEEYMEQIAGQLYDYKFYCFHGEPKIMYVAIDRFDGGTSKVSFYSLDWKQLPIKVNSQQNNNNIPKPKCFDEMLKISKILSKDFPYVRVDFYEVDGKIYVGELTFTPWGAFAKYKPRDWDYKFGEWLDLNRLEKEYIIKNCN